MSKLFALTIGKKLWLLTICTGAGIVLLAALFLISEKQLILEERQNGVRQVVELAANVVARYQGLAAAGAMPEADARRQALDALKRLRYSGAEYVWVNDMQPRMVMHPTKPELDGRDLSDNKDPTGKRIFVDFVNTAKAGGGGFVFYLWPKPGSDDPVKKVSYVQAFAPWGWVIGSGVYIDTVDAAFWSRLVRFSLATALLAALLTGLSIAITRSIVRPLHKAVGIAQNVAAGKLSNSDSMQAGAADETGQLLHALKDMNAELHTIVDGVRGGTQAIGAASSQLLAGNVDLASRTEQQASALEQTAASMEQLNSTVKQNAGHAQQADALARSASSVALKGGQLVADVVLTMEAIDISSKRIIDIIDVIDGIAFQTNILALNAAVEAARAGEQGRGFAVVAAEVRSLAQRSAAAASDVKRLIDDSVAKVGSGNVLVHQAGRTMEEIVTSVERVAAIMTEISGASREQEAGIGQVNQTVNEMDGVTQQNASLVEEAAGAAASLHEQVGRLREVVGVFKLTA